MRSGIQKVQASSPINLKDGWTRMSGRMKLPVQLISYRVESGVASILPLLLNVPWPHVSGKKGSTCLILQEVENDRNIYPCEHLERARVRSSLYDMIVMTMIIIIEIKVLKWH